MYTQKISHTTLSLHNISTLQLSSEITLPTDDLLRIYTEMKRLRILEETAYANYNLMRGFLHLTTGQESVYAAIQYAINTVHDAGKDIAKDINKELPKSDNKKNKIKVTEEFGFIGSYRCHSLAYISGSSIDEIVCELLGRSKGICKGKGGSMHLYNKNFYGGHGIVGAQVSLGTGLAFAIRYYQDVLKKKIEDEEENKDEDNKSNKRVKKESIKENLKDSIKTLKQNIKHHEEEPKENKDEEKKGEEEVDKHVIDPSTKDSALEYSPLLQTLSNRKAIFCFFGDAAANQGQFYESYNMALVHKLPIIYIIENNRYGMWTPVMDVNLSDDFYKRWNEMPGIRIRSNNVLVILSVIQTLVENIRNGECVLPVVVQIDTYRFCGHAMNDDEKYRNKNEENEEEMKDCVEEIKGKLVQMGRGEDVESVDRKVKSEIEKCFVEGKKCGLPSSDELMKDIYL